MNTDITIPASFQRCEATNRVKNFRMAAAISGKLATTYPFDDTDTYKTIGEAAYSLSLYPDKHLKECVDAFIKKVVAAQEPDGYRYTARPIRRAGLLGSARFSGQCRPAGGAERGSSHS